MKKISCVAVCNLFLLCFVLSCTRLNRNNINLTVSDSEEYYKIAAHYNKDQTNAVDIYLNDHLGKGNNISFTNSIIDADLTLDDGTEFYMKKNPGNLEIKFNKAKNSLISYKEIKNLAEGLKPVIQQ